MESKLKREYGVMKDGYDETCTARILEDLAKEFWYYKSTGEFFTRIELLNKFVDNLKKSGDYDRV